MARPRCLKHVAERPASYAFKPRGVPMSTIEEILMGYDELEALRLADLEGLYQEEAAERMGVSRPTFGRVLESAHRKVAEALVRGKALRIRGGNIEMSGARRFRCGRGHEWADPSATGRPPECPSCGSPEIRRGERPAGV